MATTTDRDYADMVNPYVRAEEEAEHRGYWRGVREAALAVAFGFALGIIFLTAFPS